MKLLTKEIRRNMPALRETEGQGDDRKVIVKFFTPWTNWTWYAFEGEPIHDDDGNEVDFQFFGLVDGLEIELGYFNLSQLQSVSGPFGLKIERDRHFGNPTLAEVKGGLREGYH